MARGRLGSRTWQRLVKIGGLLTQRARYYWLPLTGSYLTGRLFAGMLAKIAMLPPPREKVSAKRAHFNDDAGGAGASAPGSMGKRHFSRRGLVRRETGPSPQYQEHCRLKSAKI